MANQPATPMRALRVDDDLWEAARALAARRGCTISDLVREGLRRQLAEDEQGDPALH